MLFSEKMVCFFVACSVASSIFVFCYYNFELYTPYDELSEFEQSLIDVGALEPVDYPGRLLIGLDICFIFLSLLFYYMIRDERRSF